MKVGDDIQMERANWSFGGGVSETFVEHVNKSVPYYHENHELICELSDFFVLGDSVCYELGVSTGQLLRRLAEHNAQKPGVRWIGIDSEAEMVDQARRHCAGVANIDLIQEDIRAFSYEKADLIVSYYVIQFVPPRYRQELINRIYQALNWGGGFLWFEKVRAPDARFQDMITNLYWNFKRKNGFSPDEILNKAESLKGVMEPFSTAGNMGLLERAGFVDVMPIARHVCFEGYVCIK